MPRKQLIQDEDNFAKRVHILKKEGMAALMNPQTLVDKMCAAHRPSDKPVKLKIRLVGPVAPCFMELRKILEIMPDARWKVLKIARNRKDYQSGYVSDSVRIYIEPK